MQEYLKNDQPKYIIRLLVARLIWTHTTKSTHNEARSYFGLLGI